MSLFKSASIGFVLAPGFRAADVVGLHAVLGAFPGNRLYYAAEHLHCLYGKSNFPIVPNTTFAACPQLDVLVVGELPDAALENPRLIAFIQTRAPAATYVIGVSNGVVALAKAGLLQGLEATADRANTAKLAEFGAIPVERSSTVVAGKYHTSGPSTGGIESAFIVMRALRGDTVTRMLELNLEYNPQRQFSGPAHPAENGADSQADRPLKVAVLTPPRMYVPDVVGAIDVLGALPGADVLYVWKQTGEARGMLAGPTLVADTTFEQCPQVDVLIAGAVLPGYSTDTAVTDFVIRQAGKAAAVVGICEGVMLLGAAGLLTGKRATTNFHMLKLLPQVGAVPSEAAVEVDGKIYSAGPAVSSYEAALQVVRDMYGAGMAQHIEQNVLEYAPHPVFGVGSPRLAGKMRTGISKFLTAVISLMYLRAAKAGYRKNRTA